MRENALICAARGPPSHFPHRMRNLLEYLQCRLVADFTHPQRVEGAAGVSLRESRSSGFNFSTYRSQTWSSPVGFLAEAVKAAIPS